MLGCGIGDGYWAWKKAFEKLLEKNKKALAWTRRKQRIQSPT